MSAKEKLLVTKPAPPPADAPPFRLVRTGGRWDYLYYGHDVTVPRASVQGIVKTPYRDEENRARESELATVGTIMGTLTVEEHIDSSSPLFAPIVRLLEMHAAALGRAEAAEAEVAPLRAELEQARRGKK